MKSLLLLLLLLPTLGAADGHQPRYGWTCLGSSTQYAYLNADVIYASGTDQNTRYRLRVMGSTQADGQGAVRLIQAERVPEVQTGDSYTYAGTGGDASVELVIRKVEGSDQGLRSVLKLSSLAGEAQLKCNRTR